MESPRSGRHQLKHAVKLLSRDRDFRNFVIARALMTGSALLAPYIVLYSQFVSGPQMGQLGGFVFAGAAASMMSGWIWGGMADIFKSSGPHACVASCRAFRLISVAHDKNGS